MKIHLLFLITLFSAQLTWSQCSPDYDFGAEEFGISPDPTLGETFEIGYLNLNYADVVHMLVPTEAGDVDSALTGAGTIDSLRLDAVNVVIGLDTVDFSTIGLSFSCNNNGDSPNPCIFFGGEQYCADLTGIPTMAGVFPTQILVTAWVMTFLGQVALPYEFEGFSITVVDPDAVSENLPLELTLGQNSPNPASGITNFNFSLNKSEQLKFTVSNLLGETVYFKSIQGKRGSNQFNVDASQLNKGIYLYSLTAGSEKITRRMIVE